jgi:hypothetical protein
MKVLHVMNWRWKETVMGFRFPLKNFEMMSSNILRPQKHRSLHSWQSLIAGWGSKCASDTKFCYSLYFLKHSGIINVSNKWDTPLSKSGSQSCQPLKAGVTKHDSNYNQSPHSFATMFFLASSFCNYNVNSYTNVTQSIIFFTTYILK